MKNYEIETVAKFLGVTESATDEICIVDASYGMSYFQSVTTFRFGAFHAVSFLCKSSGITYDQTNRWYVSNKAYKAHQDMTAKDDSCIKLCNERVFRNESWRADKFAVTMNFKNTFDATGLMSPTLEYRFKGEFSLGFSGGSYTTTVNDFEYTDTVARFTLFNGYPCVLYSVRLYEGELSEADKLRNSFVDFCAFYDVNVSSILALDADTRTEFLESCGTLADVRNVTMGNLNANEMQENREKVLRIISECWPS